MNKPRMLSAEEKEGLRKEVREFQAFLRSEPQCPHCTSRFCGLICRMTMKPRKS